MKTPLECNIEEMLIAFPLLKETKKDVIEGVLNINCSYADIPIKGSYIIKIIIPKDYPNSLPSVTEISNKLDSTYSHKNVDKTLCLAIDTEIKMTLYPSYRLVDWINMFVIPYFYTYGYFSEYKVYPFGERSHGLKGILEYYKDSFELSSYEEVIIILRALFDKKYLKQLDYLQKTYNREKKFYINILNELKNSKFTEFYKKDYELIRKDKTNGKFIYKTEHRRPT